MGDVNGSSVDGTFSPSVPGTCPFNFTGEVEGATISGTYAAFNCSQPVSGTFFLGRQ